MFSILFLFFQWHDLTIYIYNYVELVAEVTGYVNGENGNSNKKRFLYIFIFRWHEVYIYIYNYCELVAEVTGYVIGKK